MLEHLVRTFAVLDTRYWNPVLWVASLLADALNELKMVVSLISREAQASRDKSLFD
jgi:hypothetical protein